MVESKSKVEESEKVVQKYKEGQCIVSFESRENVITQKLQEIMTQLVQAESKRQEAEVRYRQIQSVVENPEQLATVPDIMNNQVIQVLQNEELRQPLTAHVTDLCADDPALLEKLIPKYPPAGKRMLRDDGRYLRALRRANVHLLTERIEEITATGVRTADGAQHDVDVIIYGTGFHADRFLWPMKITGQGGKAP